MKIKQSMIIVFLLIILIGLIGYITYDKFVKDKYVTINECNNVIAQAVNQTQYDVAQQCINYIQSLAEGT